MILDIVRIIGGLVGLYFGGQWLVKSASRLASIIGMSPLVISVTVVAFGTSSPELLVSLNAALSGSSDIALGNVVGSNIANIGLILGVTGLIFPTAVHWRILRLEIPVMIAISGFVYLLARDGLLGQVEGAVLLVFLVAFTTFLVTRSRLDRLVIAEEIKEFEEREHLIEEQANPWFEGGRLLVGIVLLALSADFLVDGASSIARTLGVSELIIGVTLVALGTSVPELATSVVAAINKEEDIVIGNVIGSNISNLLLILGLTAVINPLDVPQSYLQFELIVMMAFAVLTLPFFVNRHLGRVEAVLLLVGYIAFVAWSLLR